MHYDAGDDDYSSAFKISKLTANCYTPNNSFDLNLKINMLKEKGEDCLGSFDFKWIKHNNEQMYIWLMTVIFGTLGE